MNSEQINRAVKGAKSSKVWKISKSQQKVCEFWNPFLENIKKSAKNQWILKSIFSGKTFFILIYTTRPVVESANPNNFFLFRNHNIKPRSLNHSNCHEVSFIVKRFINQYFTVMYQRLQSYLSVSAQQTHMVDADWI